MQYHPQKGKNWFLERQKKKKKIPLCLKQRYAQYIELQYSYGIKHNTYTEIQYICSSKIPQWSQLGKRLFSFQNIFIYLASLGLSCSRGHLFCVV